MKIEDWYKSAVIYGVDVEKFADGNGDGIGDFIGLANHIDYLQWLGITCIWLLPFYPSPRRDNGYDVTDYMNVDPRFGTLEDFIRFVHKAGEHGIRVIIDLVMDHTSDQHPWFQAARRSRSSRYRDYYIWADVPPPMAVCHGPVFPGEQHGVWTYDEMANQYYYHRFYKFQPNLNVANREVRRQLDRVMDFWLCFGVAGFRMDAVPIMLGLDDPEFRKPRDPHGVLRELRQLIGTRRPGAALLGEADVEAEQIVKYFGDDDELNMLFNFLLNNWLWLSLAEERKEPLIRVLEQLPAPSPSGQWVNFVRNLDELNLGWLEKKDRDFVLETLSPDPGTHLYQRGTRRRTAPLLGGDRRRVELALSLVLTLPGTPMIVYGDEYGMGDDLELRGRDAARLPMQWSAAPNGGFSTAPADKLVRPVLSGGPYGYQTLNVQTAQDDADSLLNRVRELIRTRRQAPEFGLGNWHIFSTHSSAILAHRCNWRDGIVIAVHNMSGERQTCELDLSDQKGRRIENMLENAVQTLAEDGFTIDLPPYGYQWYRIVRERFGGGMGAVNYV
jgi:maltose alpha-D-glucosyltransferase/alpha-amylase